MLIPYWPSLVGGMLIGLSSAMLLVVNGRVAGISGIAGHMLGRWSSGTVWRAAFLLGLVCGPVGSALAWDRAARADMGCLASRGCRRGRSRPLRPSWPWPP